MTGSLFLPLLFKLGIQGFTEQDVGSHQSYSRKTLIALVTSGILLAVLGTTGYFLMNRRSWSPAGERLVSSRVQGKENGKLGLLGRSMNATEGEEKYQKRHFCALTKEYACNHITVSVDESKQYIADWGGGANWGPGPCGSRWFVSSIYYFPWDSLAGYKPEQAAKSATYLQAC